MTILFQEDVLHQPYTASPSTATHGVEAISMARLEEIVFVVDDDVSVRESLVLLIANEGWQV